MRWRSTVLRGRLMKSKGISARLNCSSCALGAKTDLKCGPVLHMVSPMRRVVAAPKLSKAGIERALERLRELVRERGLKASTVREGIARAALGIEGHFTIEELVESLPDAHIATVYRVLPLLIDAGLLQAAPGAQARRANDRAHHAFDGGVGRDLGAFESRWGAGVIAIVAASR